MNETSMVFDVARVTIQFSTPFRLGSGGFDPLVDAFFTRDANGLPTLPGTSIAGVLRHAAEARWGGSEVRSVFGYQERDDGQSSRLRVSWGQVHDKHDRPVPFLGASLEEDGVLAALSTGLPRDHVRIGARGTADGPGKFDEEVVPAGARFTFELALAVKTEERDGQTIELGPSLGEVLDLLGTPSMRLGAGGRKGLGRFKVHRVRCGRFDLRSLDGRGSFAKLPVALHVDVPDGVLDFWQPSTVSTERWATGQLVLKPLDYWMIGGGDPVVLGERRIDLVPATMPHIVWPPQGPAELSDPVPIVPASSIKGALRHRVAFHARRLAKTFCSLNEDAGAASDTTVDEVNELFGAIAGSVDARPGRLLMADGTVEQAQQGRLDHVSLDRFTQGPLDQALFSEAPLYGGRIELAVAFDRGAGSDDAVSERALRALRHAIDDLCDARLAIGAGSNRGHGYCTGRIDWEGGITPWAS